MEVVSVGECAPYLTPLLWKYADNDNNAASAAAAGDDGDGTCGCVASGEWGATPCALQTAASGGAFEWDVDGATEVARADLDASLRELCANGTRLIRGTQPVGSDCDYALKMARATVVATKPAWDCGTLATPWARSTLALRAYWDGPHYNGEAAEECFDEELLEEAFAARAAELPEGDTPVEVYFWNVDMVMYFLDADLQVR